MTARTPALYRSEIISSKDKIERSITGPEQRKIDHEVIITTFPGNVPELVVRMAHFERQVKV